MIKKNFFIYGGCVTRDVFTNVYDHKKSLNLVEYFARYSLAKILFDPIHDMPTFELSSNFQKKMLSQELNNLLISKLLTCNYDIAIFDFLTLRLPIISFENTFITESMELKNSGVLLNNQDFKRLGPNDELFWYFWEKGLDLIISNMKKKSLLNKLYIQRLYWATHNNEGKALSNQSNISQQNIFLERAYNIALNYISANQFIEYDQKLFISDVNHKWGEAPIHYIHEFYEESLKKFSSLVD